MLPLFSGFVAGTLHVLSGPDHLAAVAPLVVRDRRQAWLAGLRWGAGHAAGVGLIAVAAVWLRGLLPAESLSSWSERLVGVLLIALGVWGVRCAFRRNIHTHEHEHDGVRHIHLHAHARGHEPARRAKHGHGHTVFGIGTLHGLAGGSHFVALVPALALPSTAQMVGYIVAYGIGSVAAMMGFSTILGWITQRFELGGTKAYRGLMLASALAAVGIGVFWLTGSIGEH